MIIVLKQNTKPEQLENLEAWIHSMGIETHVSWKNPYHHRSGGGYLSGGYGFVKSIGHCRKRKTDTRAI